MTGRHLGLDHYHRDYLILPNYCPIDRRDRSYPQPLEFQMINFVQSIFNDPKISKMFDWSVFMGGLVSLIVAVTMTVLGAG